MAKSKFRSLPMSIKRSVSPINLTLYKMKCIGKLVPEKKEIIITISHFNVEKQTWTPLSSKSFIVEDTPVGEGAFRSCYKAVSESKDFEEKTWVIKYYKDDALLHFQEAAAQSKGYTPEEQARKTFQMHALAKYFCG